MDQTCVLGLDLGTSALKAVVTTVDGQLLAQASEPLALSQPQPLHSEQHPHDWMLAANKAVLRLRGLLPGSRWRNICALGIAGQMHGAVLLDARGEVLRPAILWNDGRSQAQCDELESKEPASRTITGNRAMAGLTAPKLMWLAEHEPDCFARVAQVLLPKDYLVWRLTGEYSTDVSDAAGTLWLNLASRTWSDAMLDASGMRRSQLPPVHESADVIGTLAQSWTRHWALPDGIQVVAGAGDNAAAALGVGVVGAGEGLLSLGTSGVIFVATGAPQPHPARGLHAFCHAVPGRWHQMAVLLSAASALSWWSKLIGSTPEAATAALVQGEVRCNAPLFLPYLSGERTPHADPCAKASWLGLHSGVERDDMTYAVLEGVSFAMADALQVLNEAGTVPTRLLAVGGGARSGHWLQQLANVLGTTLEQPAEAEVGPALGAARLAVLGLGLPQHRVLKPPLLARIFTPWQEATELHAPRLARFRQAYAPLRALGPHC